MYAVERTGARPGTHAGSCIGERFVRSRCTRQPSRCGIRSTALSATCKASQRQPGAQAKKKFVWIESGNAGVITSAVERGFSTAVFSDTREGKKAAEEFAKLARFDVIVRKADGSLVTGDGFAAGLVFKCTRGAVPPHLDSGVLLVESDDWWIIPGENLVAQVVGKGGALVCGVAATASDARIVLEVLESGLDGVLLRTEDPKEVIELAEYMSGRDADQQRLSLVGAVVTRISPVGMCDRACVDIAALLRPGEGMLLGNFASGFFLVHSESLESAYINSRPFRVNAGAVSTYTVAPQGKTAYLTELKSGVEVLVVGADGSVRSEVVARVKIERRPMLLVEAEAQGRAFSVLLQNAETVRLVAAPPPKGRSGDFDGPAQAISVSALKPGDVVLAHVPETVARHTGLAVEETIVER